MVRNIFYLLMSISTSHLLADGFELRMVFSGEGDVPYVNITLVFFFKTPGQFFISVQVAPVHAAKARFIVFENTKRQPNRI